MNTQIASPLILRIADVGKDDLPLVGGKGANLGVLTRAGVRVPPGFIVTTNAFQRFLLALPSPDALFNRLDALDGTNIDDARDAAAAMRGALDTIPVPADVASAIAEAAQFSAQPLAVRSSATAEDLPGASFAGQQDSFLNVRGDDALLDAVRRCWISLFTDRAVLYRGRGGFGHRKVALAVVVQEMIHPTAAGILFTADPVTGHRAIATIDAGFGLGEALVGGVIEADLYRVERRQQRVLEARIGDKTFAIRPAPAGGTVRMPLPEAQRRARVLTDVQILELVQTGERVERCYDGVPQDIEWVLAGDDFHIVQARPITSLFPIPQASDRTGGLRIYVSFGHVQMMLDAMPRLALETWRLLLPVARGTPAPADEPRASAAAVPAGGRLFLDLTEALRVARVRRALLAALSHAYPAVAHALRELSTRPEFATRGNGRVPLAVARLFGPVAVRVPGLLLGGDVQAAAHAFDDALERLSAEAAARIAARATPAARVRQCQLELNAHFGRVRGYVAPLIAGMIAHRLVARIARGAWANDVRDDVELLLRGLPGNVTTEMDLAVGDLTDVVRPHHTLAALLGEPWPTVRASLQGVPGCADFGVALSAFLTRYGDRGAGEIDISRPRWRDDPSLLLRVIIGGLASVESGAHRRRHEAQVAAGETARSRLIDAARNGGWGWLRTRVVARLTHVARIGLGLREHLKFTIVRLLGVVRAEILAAGDALAARSQIGRAEDVWHLTYEEIAGALESASIDMRAEVEQRAAALRRDRQLRPPIAISSDGETPAAAVREDLPANAIAGTGASAGAVEGIARVIVDPEREVLQAGEILVAAFTDPGWTPLFVHASAVVTEVGGVMTHGAVVAREYGIPAVVSATGATTIIRTGQRVRVDGSRGIVEILEERADASITAPLQPPVTARTAAPGTHPTTLRSDRN